MVTKVSISTIYKCSLERAFKTPILCDITKIHTGFGVIPKVTHTSNDKDWGKPSSDKKIYVAKSITQNGGFASIDRIIERKENEYWKIQINEFQSWMLGFYKFIGEWKTTKLEERKIQIDYTYHMHSKGIILYPLCWIFGKIFWKIYMKRITENIREMIQKGEPYLYE